jgi:hypothetical protein
MHEFKVIMTVLYGFLGFIGARMVQPLSICLFCFKEENFKK